MESHDAHTPHAPHTGHKWLDFAMGAAAFVISLVSLYLGVHHGHVMEKLVTANSWPYLQLRGVIENGHDGATLSLVVENNGIGPARVESVELWAGDKPLPDAKALIHELGHQLGEKHLSVGMHAVPIDDTVLSAKSKETMLSLSSSNPAYASGFTAVLKSLESRICYCSVFDDCYLVDTRQKPTRPVRIDHCPAAKIPYSGDVTPLLKDEEGAKVTSASAPKH